MEEVTLDDIRQLIDITELCPRWIFRGLSDCQYKLLPSLSRDVAAKSQRTVLDFERSTLDLFSRRAVPNLQRSDYTKMDMAAIAQHHGMKTRLMDWTTNPLVAAFFAVRKACNETAVIYACPGEGKIDIDGDDPLKPSDDFWFVPRHVSPRIVAQAGLFSIQQNPFSEFSKPGMKRFLIPVLLRTPMRVLLNKWNVNAESMFPELDGLSERLNAGLTELKRKAK